MFFFKSNFKFKLVSMFLALVILFVSVPVPVYAAAKKDTYYKTSAGKSYSTISVSNSTLNKARDKIAVKTKAFSYSAKISSSYDMHIYHFEAPSSGYYSFHTTGSLDTVIRVYEEQNVLFWTSSYKNRGLSDDGSMADDNYFNSNLVVKLDSGEDYYICVRGYNNKIGSYILYAEENQDKMKTSAYGYNTWTSEKRKDWGSGSNYHGVCGKTYYSKNDVMVLYWLLVPATRDQVEGGEAKTVIELYNDYRKSPSKFFTYFNQILSLLPTSYGGGISMNLILSMFEIASEQSQKSLKDWLDFLTYECGVRYNKDTGWSCKSGMLKTDTFYSRLIPSVRSTYSANNDSIRKGDKCAKGSWSK